MFVFLLAIAVLLFMLYTFGGGMLVTAVLSMLAGAGVVYHVFVGPHIRKDEHRIQDVINMHYDNLAARRSQLSRRNGKEDFRDDAWEHDKMSFFESVILPEMNVLCRRVYRRHAWKVFDRTVEETLRRHGKDSSE